MCLGLTTGKFTRSAAGAGASEVRLSARDYGRCDPALWSLRECHRWLQAQPTHVRAPRAPPLHAVAALSLDTACLTLAVYKV